MYLIICIELPCPTKLHEQNVLIQQNWNDMECDEKINGHHTGIEHTKNLLFFLYIYCALQAWQNPAYISKRV